MVTESIERRLHDAEKLTKFKQIVSDNRARAQSIIENLRYKRDSKITPEFREYLRLKYFLIGVHVEYRRTHEGSFGVWDAVTDAVVDNDGNTPLLDDLSAKVGSIFTATLIDEPLTYLVQMIETQTTSITDLQKWKADRIPPKRNIEVWSDSTYRVHLDQRR